MDDVSVADLAYAAATIDCDGSIGIRVQRRGSQSPYLSVEVVVVNTNFILANWLQEMFGGSISTVDRSNERWKSYYRWRIVANQACEFLRMILPYLKLKWEQAEVALKLEGRVESYVGLFLSQDEIDARLALKEAMGILNKKGPLSG